MREGRRPAAPEESLPLPTCEVAVVDLLLDFGLFGQHSRVLGEQQLPGTGLVAFAVILDHGNSVLKGWQSMKHLKQSFLKGIQFLPRDNEESWPPGTRVKR